MVDSELLGAIVGGVCFVSVTTVLPLAIVWMRRGARHDDQTQLPAADIIARLERMELGMDSMSAEIERIGEGQRFASRLLNEREPRALENANTTIRSE